MWEPQECTNQSGSQGWIGFLPKQGFYEFVIPPIRWMP